MTPLRTRAIDAIVERYGLRRRGPVRVAPAEAVDALLAAGLLHDPDSVVAPVPWREPRFPRVQGTCPACGAHSLFLGKGGYVTCAILTCDDPCRASDILLASPPPAVRTVTTTNTQTVVPPRDDEARIERAASKFYERLRGVAIKYGAAPAWDDLSGVQRVPWIEDARQALAAADLAPEADHA